MARPALHSEDLVLDCARALASGVGPRGTSIRAIADASGAPTGSLYHHFGSRDRVLAHAWIRAIERFQSGFLSAVVLPDPVQAATEAAAWTFDFATVEPADARLLLTQRRETLLDADLPEDLERELAELNAPIGRAVADLARRLDGRGVPAERVTFAVVDLPYAAVRRHLLDGNLSAPVRDEIVAAARLLVAGGAC